MQRPARVAPATLGPSRVGGYRGAQVLPARTTPRRTRSATGSCRESPGRPSSRSPPDHARSVGPAARRRSVGADARTRSCQRRTPLPPRRTHDVVIAEIRQPITSEPIKMAAAGGEGRGGAKRRIDGFLDGAGLQGVPGSREHRVVDLHEPLRHKREYIRWSLAIYTCLLYTSDAADEEDSVDLGGRRIIKKNIPILIPGT